MAILPVEKACVRCGKRFVGRKNKVFCGEVCRTEAGNEKLMKAYYAQRGTPNKRDKANYPHNIPPNNANNKGKGNNSDNSDNLREENNRLARELAQLKQAMAAITASPQQANDSDPAKAANKREVTPERIAEAKEQAQKLLKQAGMKEKLAVAKVQLEKEAEGQDQKEKADKLAAMKVKAVELKKKLLEGDKPVKKKKS